MPWQGALPATDLSREEADAVATGHSGIRATDDHRTRGQPRRSHASRGCSAGHDHLGVDPRGHRVPSARCRAPGAGTSAFPFGGGRCQRALGHRRAHGGDSRRPGRGTGHTHRRGRSAPRTALIVDADPPCSARSARCLAHTIGASAGKPSRPLDRGHAGHRRCRSPRRNHGPVRGSAPGHGRRLGDRLCRTPRSDRGRHGGP